MPGKYTIPIIALIVACYMVTNFTPLILFVGLVVAVVAAVIYFFIDRTDEMEEMEKLHQEFLDKLRHNKVKF